ncbi:MAG: outer membrane lipoprotein chaperone LolA [Pseudomonadales bacterium]
MKFSHQLLGAISFIDIEPINPDLLGSMLSTESNSSQERGFAINKPLFWQWSARITVVAALSLSFSSSALYASEALATKQFQALLSSMQSFSAKFSQTVYDDQGEELQASAGVTKVRRPGKLYWESTEPFNAVTVSNGSRLWHYDVDLEQVTVSTLSEDLSQTPALILGGNPEALEKSFTISFVASDEKAFLLTPRVADGVFSAIEFRFGSNELLSAMTIFDSLQQKTEITFSGASLNGEIDDSLFDFAVPDDVDLIDNTLTQSGG